MTTSHAVEVTIQDRGIYGIRRTLTCSCGLVTVQRACDGSANLCGRCGYLNDYTKEA